MKKRFFSLAAVLITAAVLSCGAVGAQAPAELPFEAYAYNGDSEPVSIPAPYTVEKVVTAGSSGFRAFPTSARSSMTAGSGCISVTAVTTG